MEIGYEHKGRYDFIPFIKLTKEDKKLLREHNLVIEWDSGSDNGVDGYHLWERKHRSVYLNFILCGGDCGTHLGALYNCSSRKEAEQYLVNFKQTIVSALDFKRGEISASVPLGPLDIPPLELK